MRGRGSNLGTTPWGAQTNISPGTEAQNAKPRNLDPESMSYNPWQAEIESVKRLLVIMNPKAGWRAGSDLFATSVSETLDKAGVVHKIVDIPPLDIQTVLKDEGYEAQRKNHKGSSMSVPQWDGVMIAGGDGTVNSYAYAMTQPQFKEWRQKPIALLPTGMHNGLAHSLGISHAGATNAALISGRHLEVPVFLASTMKPNDPERKKEILSASLSGINIGLFADALVSSDHLRDYMMGFMTLPVPRKRNFWATLYQVAKMNESVLPQMSVRITDPKTGAVRGLEQSFSMLVAQQTVFHHKGYSLTPHAEIGKGFSGPIRGALRPKLAVTTVATKTSLLLKNTINSAAASSSSSTFLSSSPFAARARMLHLLLREAALAGQKAIHNQKSGANATLQLNDEIEKEDGVDMFEAEAIELCLSSNNNNNKARKFLLDGEECELQPGHTLRLAPSTLALKFMIP